MVAFAFLPTLPFRPKVSGPKAPPTFLALKPAGVQSMEERFWIVHRLLKEEFLPTVVPSYGAPSPANLALSVIGGSFVRAQT